jgi:hypothetical protein
LAAAERIDRAGLAFLTADTSERSVREGALRDARDELEIALAIVEMEGPYEVAHHAGCMRENLVILTALIDGEVKLNAVFEEINEAIAHVEPDTEHHFRLEAVSERANRLRHIVKETGFQGDESTEVKPVEVRQAYEALWTIFYDMPPNTLSATAEPVLVSFGFHDRPTERNLYSTSRASLESHRSELIAASRLHLAALPSPRDPTNP